MLGKGTLGKLRRTVRVHMNWFIAALLGEDVLTADERAELASFKKLPTQDLNLVQRSFILGRLKSIFKKGEWKDLDWESLTEAVDKAKLSPLEKLALQEAKIRAASHIKGLAEDIANGVFVELQRAQNSTVSEASIKEIIRDEVALGILSRKNYKQVASSLAQRTKTAVGPRWVKISRTELHRAKVSGSAQAIINKVDIFKNSAGINSDVSIVPTPGTCPDCADHYLVNGNPKVFKLHQLMGAGSNGDPNVSHTQKNHLHVGWKTTLPPLHPHCQCNLVFVPPGFSWVGGLLRLTDPAALSKAIGDSKLSATVKPPGPPQPSKPPSPASIPGVKAPGQATPPSTPGVPSGVEVQYVPKSESPQRPKGAIGETSNSWKVIPGATSGKPLTSEQESAKKQEEIKSSKAWGDQDHPHQVILDHLAQGDFADVKPLGESGAAQKGQFESYLVSVASGGQGIMKPRQTDVKSFDASSATELMGDTTTIPGTQHHREVGSYNLHMALGLTSHVPPTTLRTHEGRQTSVQEWKNGFAPLGSLRPEKTSEGGLPGDAYYETAETSKKADVNLVQTLLAKAPADKKDALEEKLMAGACMQLAMNSGDAHEGNVIVNEDASDVAFIDSGAAFGHSLFGCTSMIASDMHRAGMKLKIPQTLNDKYSKMSVGDIARAAPGVDTREHAQTFLRIRYIQHLQATEGHVDYNRFKATQVSANGDVRERAAYWGGDKAEAQQEFMTRALNDTLPHQQFEKFSKNFLKEAKFGSTDIHGKHTPHPDQASVAHILDNDSVGSLFMAPKEFIETKVKPHATNVVVSAKSQKESNQMAARMARSKARQAANAKAAPEAQPTTPPEDLGGTVVPKRRQTARKTFKKPVEKSLWLDMSKSWH